MRKEPLRRYSSVAQFATDVRAYLDGLPVVAQRDTFGYRMKKFVQRHAAGVAAAVFVLVSMIVATGVSVYFAREATREKKIAELRFQDTRELARFFIRDFDAAIRAGQTAARRELVNKGLSYLKRLANEAADLELQREVISGYLAVGDVQGNPFGPNLGEVEGARLSYAEALRLAEQYLKLNPGRAELRKDISAATMKLADLDVQSGNRKGALERYLSAKAALEGRDLAILLTKTGFAYYALGDYRRALDEYGKGLDLLREYLRENPGHSETKLLVAQASQRVGDILRKIGEPDAAIATLEDALKTFRELLATDPSNTLWNRGQIACTVILGDTLMAAKRPRDAEARYRESLASAESAMKLDRANMQYQRDFLTASGRLAGLLIDVPGKRNEARSLTARSLETLREMASRPDADSHEMYSYAWMLLTTPFTELQNPKAALFFAAKVSEKRGTADPSSLDLLARAYFANGDSRTATRLEQQALSLLPTDFKSTDLRKEFEDNLRRFQHGARQAAKQ
jgi:tetratricopeptide (TPR) repeat protein